MKKIILISALLLVGCDDGKQREIEKEKALLECEFRGDEALDRCYRQYNNSTLVCYGSDKRVEEECKVKVRKIYE